jgi:hypothetical protein
MGSSPGQKIAFDASIPAISQAELLIYSFSIDRASVSRLVADQFVVTTHPVGQQKVDSIALAAPAIAAVYPVRIAVPFAHWQFVIWQDDQSLLAIEPVIQNIHRNIQPV